MVKPNPVTEGAFADGQDVMLWNPAITAKHWRAELIRAFASCCRSIPLSVGVAVLALGPGIAKSVVGVLTVGVAGLLVLSCLCGAVVTAGCVGTDHRHRRGRKCRLERRPGEFFFRTRDFADLSPRVHRAVAQLIGLVGELDASSGQRWSVLDVPERAHQLAWEALSHVSRSRAARRQAQRLAEAPGEAEVASPTTAAVEMLDDELDELVFQLQACVTLSRAWEAKLDHAEFVQHAEAVRGELRAASIGPIVAFAGELPTTVFAYVTAARDLTNAGPFPWESQISVGESVR
ncbi:hypothetical protein [Amycolatopsis sp. NPDC098790]|uniref:hypothetical protein n=1 Tax=Amycolatopsis sp. NPDC098790 TaxID=3363939 RepID=UPI003811E7A8